MKKKTKIIILLTLAFLLFSMFQGSAKENIDNTINNIKSDSEYNHEYKLTKKIQEEKAKEFKEKRIEILSAKINMDSEILVKENKSKEIQIIEDYISELSGLCIEDSKYLIEASENIGVDPFIILGLIRYESNFDPDAVGTKGERGLGQLMANTAKPVAENLEIEYNPDKLFEPKYNILLFSTQFKYLYDFYEKDIHKTLTAYNRGQYGLEKYIASRESHRNPEVSSYSTTVLDFSEKFKNEFDNIQ